MADDIELDDLNENWGDDDDDDDTTAEETSFGGIPLPEMPDTPITPQENQRQRLRTEKNIARWEKQIGRINRDDIEFRSEGDHLYVKRHDEGKQRTWVRVTQRNPRKFYALSVLKGILGVSLYEKIGLKEKEKKIRKVEEEIAVVEMDQETSVKQIDRLSDSLRDLSPVLPRRELFGLDKSLKTIRGSLVVQESKKVELERTLSQWRDDLERNPDDRDRIEREIAKTRNELDGVRESIDILNGKLRSQIRSVKETVSRLLDGNTSLGERIATLFREQGITLVSVLTAIGMTIGFLVELLIPGSPPPPSPPPKPSDKGGLKEWVKKQLDALGDLLSKLAKKLGNALPGILGSIASWLLSTLGKASVWLGEHLWFLATMVVGLLLTKLDEKKKRK